MLIAHLGEERIDAEKAKRDDAFCCPVCREAVILRRGRKVVAHFAHRPRARCIARTGETRAHLEAKRVLLDAFRARGLRVEAEYATIEVAEDRRADVMVWSPGSGTPLAIELQHSRISVPDLERRAHSFARAGIAQLWVPFLDESSLQSAEVTRSGTVVLDRYPIPFHMLWMAGLVGDEGLWMYQPGARKFWRATFTDHMLMTKEALWYEMGAVKHYRRGGERRSRRFRTLYLEGPWSAVNLRLRVFQRGADASAWFNWPEARVATFVPVSTPERP
jgi:hypothetical protein